MNDHIRQSNLIENIDDPEEDEVSKYAWAWLEKQKKIDQPTLLELHHLITCRQMSPEESGHYRNIQVYVGRHVPPAPMIAQGMMYGWIIDLMENWKYLDPKEMHVQFEKIHPFVDGNGRTGRMLMWWHEKKLGQEPSLIPYEHRQDYYAWFRD
jgi:Fic family protein